jgi:type IV pilus assembly protein PilC
MEFVCRVGTPDGAVVRQVYEGAAESTLRAELEAKGFHVFKIRPRGFALSLSLPRFGSGRVPDQAFLVFNQELAALLKAGLPLVQALDLLLERGKEGRLRSILKEIRERVANGAELSDAFDHFGPAFPPLYAPSLKAGERSGELEQVIRRFIRYQQLMLETRRKVVSAIVYPTVLLCLSVVMVGIMSLYVIPQFEGFFGALDVELPALTKAILSVSVFVRGNAVLLAFGLLALIYLAMQWARTRRGRLLIHSVLLRIPLAGTILHRFSLSQFARSVGTLLRGGIPLLPSIEISVQAVANTHLQERMSGMARSVAEGQAFHQTLESSGAFTKICIDMVKVGESTGALDEMLEEVASFLDQEAETRLERLLILIEPLMLVVMGVVIGVLLMAMYLPMFSAWGQMR